MPAQAVPPRAHNSNPEHVQVTPGVMWTFEQAQTFAGFRTSTNIRMTVIKLLSGVLWVHAPIAPTAECIRLMRVRGRKIQALC